MASYAQCSVLHGPLLRLAPTSDKTLFFERTLYETNRVFFHLWVRTSHAKKYVRVSFIFSTSKKVQKKSHYPPQLINHSFFFNVLRMPGFKRKKYSRKSNKSRKGYKRRKTGRSRKSTKGRRNGSRKRKRVRFSKRRGVRTGRRAVSRFRDATKHSVKGRSKLGRLPPGPWDKLIDPRVTETRYTQPNQQGFGMCGLHMSGDQVGFMLVNIRFESPYADSATPSHALLFPTLYVRGITKTTFYNCGSSTLVGSYVVQKARGTTESELSTIFNAFDRTWSISYDVVPTGYESFPGSSLSANKVWWGTAGLFTKKGKGRKGREVSFSLRTGQHLDIYQRSACKFKWEDYAGNSVSPIPGTGLPAPSPVSAADGGFFRGRTSNIVYRVHGELGQTCGVSGGSDIPILTATGTNFLVQDRSWFQYKWAAGNNKPSIYGSWQPAGTTVPTGANSFIGVPEIKSMRAGTRFGAPVPFGGLDLAQHQESNINFLKDCNGNLTTPGVGILGQPIEVVIS